MKSNDITNDVAKRLAQSTAIERRMSENAAYRKACRRELYELMSLIEEVVFPAFFGELPLPEAVSRIRKIVRHQASEIRLGDEATIADVADRFIERLPDIKHSVLEDVEAVAKIDPAVTDMDCRVAGIIQKNVAANHSSAGCKVAGRCHILKSAPLKRGTHVPSIRSTVCADRDSGVLDDLNNE